jgi:hypothetical protein
MFCPLSCRACITLAYCDNRYCVVTFCVSIQSLLIFRLKKLAYFFNFFNRFYGDCTTFKFVMLCDGVFDAYNTVAHLYIKKWRFYAPILVMFPKILTRRYFKQFCFENSVNMLAKLFYYSLFRMRIFFSSTIHSLPLGVSSLKVDIILFITDNVASTD